MITTQSSRQPGANRHSSLLLACLLGPLATLSASSASAELPQIIDLGTNVSPTDINNPGTVVGSRQTDSGSIGFRWTAEAGIKDIVGTTSAHAVNDRDQITGNTLFGAFLFDGSLHESEGVGGYGINELGQISGNKQLKNPYRATPLPLDPAIYTPNRWDNLGTATVYPRGTRQGVYADLYVLDDINDTGYAVGSRKRYGLSGSSAILTTPAFRDVTYLSFPNGGTASAINNQNMIVGTSGSNSAAGEYAHAYLLDYNTGVFVDLETLHGGLTSSAADINEKNQVVGTSWLVTELTSVYDPTQYHAFIWDGQMTDLNSMLPVDSGWILTSASAINDNGDIVGSGMKDGQVHGFLLTTGQTPAPAAKPPVAIASADVTAGKAPLTVSFSSTGSYDPDGDIVSYQWDFGDGSPPVTTPDASHDYTARGKYIAVLTVTDSQGLTSTAQVDINARKSKGKR